MNDKPRTQYNSAVQQIKAAILKSQATALANINQEQLSLYYAIGRYISYNTRKGFWGKGAIAAISAQLQAELPGLRGFGETNLKKMRLFYEEWRSFDDKSSPAGDDLGANSPTTVGELQRADNHGVIIRQKHLTNLMDIPIAAFFSISFSHHYIILSKVKSKEGRLFYINLCSELHLSKRSLIQKIAEDAFHNQGKMPNNFSVTIPEHKQAFKAIQMFKDEYLLDFINVEQLGEREEEIDERVIENEIVHNMRNFIMTFGRGFSFIGNQVHYDKLGHDHWVDLLFFNRILKSLVVVELKKGAFKPSYLGQLTHYLHVLDDDERIEGENQSVGIILCKDADKTFVEYVLQDYNRPMGVATYKARQQKLKDLLPDEEEMKKIMA